MKKLPAPLLSVLLVFSFFVYARAQDSVPKTKPVSINKVKPFKKSATYPYKPVVYKPRYYRKPGDSTNRAYQKTPVADTNQKTAAKPFEPSDKSLAGQFQYLLTKVYFYQQPLLNAYHKSITDTLRQVKIALKAAQAKASGQAKVIDSLQNSIKSNNQSLNESNAKVDSINVFGVVMPKSTYNLLMWGLVLIFALIAIIVLSRSGAYSREAKYRVQLYNELDEEYKNYKIKANEKEKKLARELQTERNKLDDLLGRS